MEGEVVRGQETSPDLVDAGAERRGFLRPAGLRGGDGEVGHGADCFDAFLAMGAQGDVEEAAVDFLGAFALAERVERVAEGGEVAGGEGMVGAVEGGGQGEILLIQGPGAVGGLQFEVSAREDVADAEKSAGIPAEALQAVGPGAGVDEREQGGAGGIVQVVRAELGEDIGEVIRDDFGVAGGFLSGPRLAGGVEREGAEDRGEQQAGCRPGERAPPGLFLFPPRQLREGEAGDAGGNFQHGIAPAVARGAGIGGEHFGTALRAAQGRRQALLCGVGGIGFARDDEAENLLASAARGKVLDFTRDPTGRGGGGRTDDDEGLTFVEGVADGGGEVVAGAEGVAVPEDGAQASGRQVAGLIAARRAETFDGVLQPCGLLALGVAVTDEGPVTERRGGHKGRLGC